MLLLLSSEPAFAGDPFEIQVYDGTSNPPLVPSVELHLNGWPTGRRDAAAPEAPPMKPSSLSSRVHLLLERSPPG